MLHLQSQLRSKLVCELRHLCVEPSTLWKSSIHSDENDKGTLLQRAANSLVVDHLKQCQYDFSLSVFLPESGITQAKVCTVFELPVKFIFSPLTELLSVLL